LLLQRQPLPLRLFFGQDHFGHAALFLRLPRVTLASFTYLFSLANIYTAPYYM